MTSGDVLRLESQIPIRSSDEKPRDEENRRRPDDNDPKLQ